MLIRSNDPGRPRWHGYLQLALILGAIALALYFARAPDRVERGAVPLLGADGALPAVRVIQPALTEEALTVELTGSVNLEERARVASEVVGRVVWVSPSFSNGGSIPANETFVEIDPAEYELRVEAAAAAMQRAEARVGIETARGEADAAAFERENPGVEPSEWVRRLPAIAEAEAELMRAQAELALAELQLARTNISLPYDSRVVNSDVEVGELVGPEEIVGEAGRLGVVYRVEALQVDAAIDPRDLAYLDPVIGRSARVIGDTETWAAEVARVSSIVAPTTRLATVFLKFSPGAGRDSLPRPGAFVEVEIEGPTHADVYVLPESVVQENERVWVVRDGALNAFAPEAVGRTDQGWVVEAFDAGDGVVVGTLPGAREGMEVAVAGAAPSE